MIPTTTFAILGGLLAGGRVGLFGLIACCAVLFAAILPTFGLVQAGLVVALFQLAALVAMAARHLPRVRRERRASVSPAAPVARG